MSVMTPDPRYYKDGTGLHPRLRLILKAPKFYLWCVSPLWFKKIRFAVQGQRRRRRS